MQNVAQKIVQKIILNILLERYNCHWLVLPNSILYFPNSQTSVPLAETRDAHLNIKLV